MSTLDVHRADSRGLPPFQPPWWLGGAHAQTLAAAFWPARLPDHRAVARQVELDDGDIVVVHDDCPESWTNGGRVALLTHGLGGCHRSPLLVRLAAKLNERGVRVFRWDMRGCGAGVGLARRPYHAGCSDDLRRVIASVLGWCSVEESAGHTNPTSEVDLKSGCRLTLFGVSLSGNILLKYLGESPQSIPSQIEQAIAVNPPIDLAASVRTLSGRINRMYDRHFVGSLTRHLAERQRLRPDALRPNSLEDISKPSKQRSVVRPDQRDGPEASDSGPSLRSDPATQDVLKLLLQPPRTLYEFDDRYTAPMSGFPDANTYYARCSAAQFVPYIQTPTTIITSRNDPMVPVDMFSPDRVCLPESVRLLIANGGGHVGYIGRAGLDPDVHWLDWRVVELVTAS